jgi:protein-S-isoprenylcysteine O-methyltransferase Ste14
MVRRAHYIAVGIASGAAVGSVLFALAGRLDLPWLWAYTGAFTLVMASWMALIDRDLLKERLHPGPGAVDRRVIVPMKLLVVVHLVIAAADIGRLHWSDTVPAALHAAGLAGYLAGVGLATWAMVVNPFFSEVVRLQADRGHVLITAGPYRLLRHPGYTGMCLWVLCSTLAHGSWLSGLPALLFGLLILRRTAIEDQFLWQHLDGYADYLDRVRWRLLPGVW